MKYKIIWSRFSENQIDGIFSYYERKVNAKLAAKIVRRIVLAPDILINAPNIGTLEPLLQDREIEYRYIVSSNYKIIYSINDADQSIRIADVFDTRQDPNKMEQRVR